jgi:putative hydrolase of the HAD superfamily
MMHHIFFDLFGTLIQPSQSARLEGIRALSQIFPNTQEHIAAALSQSFGSFENACAASLAEYSMEDVIQRCNGLLGLNPLSTSELSATTRQYLTAWSKGITFNLSSLTAIRGLGIPFSVVTNTHSRYLIDHCMAIIGVTMVDVQIYTSIEHGYRKPHPTIYQLALERANCAPSDCLFVGDDYLCDYIGPSKVGIKSHLLISKANARVPQDRQHLNVQNFLESLDGSKALDNFLLQN